MSVVRLNVPPFTTAAPTSLSALRRQLVQPETFLCENRCQPCAICQAAHDDAVKAAEKLASDTGLRLSQLVEDALAVHVKRIENEQAQLVTTVLRSVLPHLSDAVLRSALAEEIAKAADPHQNIALRLAKHPSLDLGPLPDGAAVEYEDDPSLPEKIVEIRNDGGATRIDPETLIAACLSRLGVEPQTTHMAET